MEPLAVVEDFDVVEEGAGRLGTALKMGAVDEFFLERAPEALHGGVVVAVASAAHARRDFPGGEMLAVRLAGVLASSVGVVEQPRLGRTLFECHPQRVQRQVRLQVFAHRPADHTPAAQVEHARQIQPALGGGSVGDVRCPHFVGSLHRSLALPEPVGRDGLRVVAVRSERPPSSSHSASESLTPPDPSDPVPPAGVPRPSQRSVQSRAAVGAAAAHEKRVNLYA